jgi:hypothetical protein
MRRAAGALVAASQFWRPHSGRMLARTVYRAPRTHKGESVTSRPRFRLRYAAGALMVLGMLALAACGGGASTGSTSGGSSSANGTGSNQQAQMIAQKIQQEKLTRADVTLQASLNGQNQGTASTNSAGTMTLNPFALQLTSTANSNTSSNGSNSFQGETILVNNTAYVKQNGQSQWRAAALPASTSQSVPYVSLQTLTQTQNLQMANRCRRTTCMAQARRM